MPKQHPDRPPPRPPLEAASDDRLRRLAERARELDALDRLLRQCLPEPLASRTRLANVRQGRLVFLVDAAGIATALRLHTPELVRAAQAAGVEASALTVKVATMRAAQTATAAPLQPPLSTATQAKLRAAAGHLDDPELRDRLLRLASMADS